MSDALLLRGARRVGSDLGDDVRVAGGRIVAARGAEGPTIELAGRSLLPGLVNALDVLDLSVFPALGTPPFASLYDWAGSAGSDLEAFRAALAVPLADRLFLGGLRNLLAGATAVVHHHSYHRSLGREDFPVRVLSRYQFADSPGRTKALRRTYRSSDRRIPWLVRAAEGTDATTRSELDALTAANVLRQNTVILHGTGLRPEDGPRIAAARAALVWCPEADRRLYGTTAPVAALRAAGVKVGLGSDSPATGARDALSNLAAARREGVLDDAGLIALATAESGAVARLPVGGLEEGSVADLVAVDDLERWFGGDRRAIALVLVGGRLAYGDPELLAGAAIGGLDLTVDGVPRRLATPLAARLRALLKAHPAVSTVTWLRGVCIS